MEKNTIDLPEVRSMAVATPWKRGVKLLRFKDWSVQNGVFLLGAFFSDDFLSRPLDFIVASLALSCFCLAYGYSLNEFFDDLQEQLIDNPAAAAGLHRFIYLLLFGALVLAWFISTTCFAVVVLIGVTVWLHSSPPFRLKRRLFWRLFLNSMGFGLFFVAGAALDDQLSAAELCMGAFIYGLYLPLELIHVLAHKQADEGKGLVTFAHIHGERKTVLLAAAILLGLIAYCGSLWWLQLMSAALALWSTVTLALLIWALVSFYKREHTMASYAKLRFQVKVLCAVYGIGALSVLAAKL